jgi:hypothetical protein
MGITDPVIDNRQPHLYDKSLMYGKSPARGRRMRPRHYRSTRSGITLVEFSAAVVFGLPLVMTMLYAVIEANLFFTIRTNLDVAVRRAAQKMITEYNKNGTEPTPVSADHGELPINCQFNIASGDGHFFVKTGAQQFTYFWDMTSGMKTVHVYVYYPAPAAAAGQNIVPFPFPDPFKIGNNLNIWSCGTFRAPG